MDTTDLTQSHLYINRELSLLEFNLRVLEEAKKESIPLLERLNYLCISSSNLDEFFEIRLASLLQIEAINANTMAIDGLTTRDQQEKIFIKAHKLVTEQYKLLNEVLIPTLRKENIFFLRRKEWSENQKKWLSYYFNTELLPILTPVGLDSAHPFPRILNKSLNFIISLTGKDAFGRKSGRAILQVPRALPTVIELPAEVAEKEGHHFVFLSSIIHEFINELFNGMSIKGCHQFRVTRNSDLLVDDDTIDDLMNAVKGELMMRNYGDEVRLEVDAQSPEETLEFLLTRFQMKQSQLYLANGPVNLSRVQGIYGLIDRPDLKFTPFNPVMPPQFGRNRNIFDAIKKQDILLHHPYDSFIPVIEFIRQAASDPSVLAIKQTLYRTGIDSPIVNTLIKAARADKEVTVVIELLARFDEKENIGLANKLQEAAVHVVYGVVGYKTHAKMCLVLRKEGKTLRNYLHLGTGNYHQKTTRLYTDYGLFSCDKVLGEDVRRVFVQLTSLGKVTKLNKLLQSPFTLFSGLIAMIEREIENANNGKPAAIIIKINSLVEEKSIQALYKASQAGVKINLIVRGICCLRPGIKGISENIEVRSIIGRFLEHTRVYAFQNNDSWEVYGASADLMARNLFKRVETCFPIENKKLSQRILKNLESYLKDNDQAWILQSNGSYRRVQRDEKTPIYQAQTELLKENQEISFTK